MAQLRLFETLEAKRVFPNPIITGWKAIKALINSILG